MTPCIADTTFCIFVRSGIIAIAAFRLLDTRHVGHLVFHQREQSLLDLDDELEHLSPVRHRRSTASCVTLWPAAISAGTSPGLGRVPRAFF
jgi:hypothetical protein